MQQSQPINIVITGAAGQIAYSFIGFLGTGQVLGQNQTFNLKLLDLEQMLPKLKGLQLELEDCGYSLINSIEIGFDPLVIFKDADIVVFLGGLPRQQGQERKDLLIINNKIFKAQAQALNQVAKKTCKSIVVANPANTNCLTLALNCPNIPKKNFTCLTFLDHTRSIVQLAQKANVAINDVKNVSIWGNHSSTQFPNFYTAVIKDKPAIEVIKDEKFLQTEFITKVQKRGEEILKARGLSSVISAANATKDHIRNWIQGTREGEFVSFGVITENTPYGISNDLCFSFPVKCKHFEWEIVKDIALNDFAKEKIKLTEKELIEEKQIAFQ